MDGIHQEGECTWCDAEATQTLCFGTPTNVLLQMPACDNCLPAMVDFFQSDFGQRQLKQYIANLGTDPNLHAN